jgi:hypothetical protein
VKAVDSRTNFRIRLVVTISMGLRGLVAYRA